MCTTRQHINWPEYPRLWVPKCYKDRIWSAYHERLGHAGNRKVIHQVGIYYRWPAMWKTGATNYMRCGLYRVHSEQQQHSPPTNMPVAQLPGDLVAADLVGPFPISPKGNRYILTIMDHATAWVEVYPIPSKSQEHVISRFHTDYFPRFGTPKVLITDQGMEFHGSQFKDYLTAVDVDHRRTSPYHPQTNGTVGMLKQILRKLTITNAVQWEEQLGPCLWVYRTTIGVNGFTPYFLQYGCEPNIPQTMLHSSFGVENDATERYQQLADAFHIAAKCTEEAQHYNNERRQ